MIPPPRSLKDPAIRAVILSGGAAKRAGGINKSLMMVEAKRIIEHQLERLAPAFEDRISVVTDRPAEFAPFGLPCVSDLALENLASEKSSLRGFASALAAFPESWCFLIPADMPWPSIEILERLVEWIRDGIEGKGLNVLGAGFMGPKGPKPFHAVYHGTLAASAIRALSEAEAAETAKKGMLSVRRWISGNPQIHTLDPAKLGISSATFERAFANFNSVPSADD